MLAALSEGKGSKIIKYALMSLFLLATAGMFLMDVGGFFRGGVVSNTVAKIGSRTISLPEFERTATNYLRGQRISMQDAYKSGLTDSMLEGMIGRELMLQEAQRLGIVISDKALSTQITALIRPQALGGEKPQETLDRLLRAQNMREADFSEAMRGDLTLNTLNAAMTGAAATTPDLLASALSRAQAERRTVSYVTLDAKALKIDPKPDDATITAYYKTVENAFAKAELRHFKALIFDTNKAAKSVTVTDADAQIEYKAHPERFATPERREIIQCIYKTEQAAKDALAKDGFKGSACQPAAMFEKEGLPASLSAVVFTAAQNDVTKAPVQSPFGWHIAKVTKVVASGTKPFDEVKESLKRDLTMDKVRTLTDDRVNKLERALSDGMPVEEIAKGYADLALVDLPLIDKTGKTGTPDETTKKIAKDKDLQAMLFEMQDGETTDLQDLSDGIYAAFSLREVQASTPKPLSEIRKQVEERWMAENRARQIDEKLAKLLETLPADGTALKTLAQKTGASIETIEDLSPIAGGTPFGDETTKNALFRMPVNGTVKSFVDNDARVVAQVTAAHFASKTAESTPASALHGLDLQLVTDAMRSAFKQAQGVTIHRDVLDRAYGSKTKEADE